jgi:hypothetical protein
VAFARRPPGRPRRRRSRRRRRQALRRRRHRRQALARRRRLRPRPPQWPLGPHPRPLPARASGCDGLRDAGLRARRP